MQQVGVSDLVKCELYNFLNDSRMQNLGVFGVVVGRRVIGVMAMSPLSKWAPSLPQWRGFLSAEPCKSCR